MNVDEHPYEPHFNRRWIRATPAPPGFGVTLEFAPLWKVDRLEALYTIRNSTNKTYAVFNHVSRGDLHDVNFVQIDFTGTALLLSKQVVPWPEMFLSHNDPPAQSLIEPGGSLSERIVVPLPAVVNNWVRQTWLEAESMHKKKYRAEALRKTRRVTLIIGIIEVRSGMRVMEHVRAPGVFSVEGMDPDVDQLTLARTVVLPDTIEVLDYEGKP